MLGLKRSPGNEQVGAEGGGGEVGVRPAIGEEIGTSQSIAGAHRVQRKPEQRAPGGGFGGAEQGRDAVRMDRAHLQTGVDEVEAAL